MFSELERKNYFQYDVVQAGGTQLSKTFVTRTLIGEPGITYKYLGLRLYAHPWSGKSIDPASPQAKQLPARALRKMKQLNTVMVARGARHLQENTVPALRAKGGNEEPGSTVFNLTLINRMAPQKCVGVCLLLFGLFRLKLFLFAESVHN